MSFSALGRYYVKLFELNLDFFFLYCYKTFEQYGKTAHHSLEQVQAVPSILHTIGVNWNSRSEIDTANTGRMT